MNKIAPFILLSLLTACMGREAIPIMVYQDKDDALSCSQIKTEILDNENEIFDLEEEQRKIKNKNIAWGGAGLLLFPPVALAMDLKDAPGAEMTALKKRNRNLESKARTKNCNL